MKPVQKINHKMREAVIWMIMHPGFKQTDLAKAMGLHEQTIHQWMNSPVFLEYYDEQLRIAWADTVRTAQLQVAEKVKRGDRESCFFVLKTVPEFNPAQKIEANVSDRVITVDVIDD